MNTNKQITVMVVLVFIAVLATGAYTLWDPSRASDARATQLQKTVDRGAFTFSQNCRLCHGDAGEGGAASNRLAQAPPLNRPDLQGKKSKDAPADPVAKVNEYKRIYYTITCGRVGTPMPTWGNTQGGPLNDEQIKQLATMITEGTGWEDAKKYGLEGAPEFNINTGSDSDHLKLAQALDATSTSVVLEAVERNTAPLVTPNIRLQIDDELMLVTDINKDNSSVTVQRHLGTTKAAAHQAGSAVLKPPIPPDPPSITGKDSSLPCGQNLPAAAGPTAAGGASPTTEAASTNLTITAENTAWDKSTLTAVAGQPLTVAVDNKDSGVSHNIHFFKGADATGTDVASTQIQPGPATETLNFGPLAAGDYFYQCDVHPTQMTGTLTAK
jgi:plastocyanin/mono/diheme cytochrome c family protein